MADGIWAALSGLKMRQRSLESVANRLANSDTVGFRDQVLLQREHRSSSEHIIVDQAPADMTLRHLAADHVMVRPDGSQVREEEGAFQFTGKPLDLALRGAKGYFVIAAEQGGELLSRDGRFRLNPDGRLETLDGRPVLGEGGEITIPPDTDLTSLAVLPNGEISVDDTAVGRLRLGYAPPQTLRAVGANRFESAAIQPAEEVEVAQGYQEQSTVNAVKAMVDLIDLHRAFDANMKLVSAFKELDEQAVALLR